MKYPVLITSIYDSPEMLRWFLPHYQRLGVREFHIAVYPNQQFDLIEKVREQCKNYPVILHVFDSQNYNSLQKHENQQHILARAKLHRDDYYMNVDLDEFHEYPAHLTEIIKCCDRQNIPAIRGYFLDRVSESGKLLELTDQPLSLQAPWGCYLTKTINKGRCQKIMLLRATHQLRGLGSHYLKGNCKYLWPIGSKSDYKVHHFKWFAPALRRGIERLRSGKIGDKYRQEWQRFLAHYELEERIQVEMPELQAQRYASFPVE